MKIGALSIRQADMLGEISNIGVGHAATALAQMIGRQVRIRVPNVTITPFSCVPEAVGGPERPVAAAHCQFMGDITGHILMLFPRESVETLMSRLLGHSFTPSDEWGERGASSIREIGNILASSYLNALGTMLHMTLIPSLPSIAYDMAGAVVDSLLIEQGLTDDVALLIETEFFEQDEKISGHFLLLPDPDSVTLVISQLSADPG